MAKLEVTLPQVTQVVQGKSKRRKFTFWVVTLGPGWHAELVFN
jgi:hypothetical protein